jgi:dipeptidyl aminopeptidase/acylaminoacyl peptidase
MSPEQARGEPGDQRSDLFAFGCVLYEMVSGRRAFQRDTAVETLTAALREEPPELTGSGSVVPPALVRVIHHCLEKNPVERFQSARDIAFALDALSTGTTSMIAPVDGGTSQSAAGVSARRPTLRLAAALIIMAAAPAFFAGRASRPPSSPPSFAQLTFRPQTVFRALFAPDGKTIVYSAAPHGNRVELFSVSPDYPESRSFGLHDVQLLSVSSKNELAVLTNARYVSQRLYRGTLARMPISGGAPREILENVREADWSPDGEQLAIIRTVGGSDRLEFPIGKVLYETPGYVSDVRVSPDGSRIAFFEHPSRWDDRGAVAVVDRAGTKTTLAAGYAGLEGLAWSRDGGELIYSDYKVYAVTMAGVVRQLLESAGGLTLFDVSADGRWLAARDDVSAMLWVKPPDGTEELNLSWLESSSPRALSADGRLLLLTEFGIAAGSTYAVAVRKTDGSPIVRLGTGSALDLSPDGARVVANLPDDRAHLVIFPTGPGDVRKLDGAPIVRYQSARWFADGTRLLVCGIEAARPVRCYVQDANGGAPRAVTPEGTSGGYVSRDGNWVMVRRGDAAVAEIYPIAGGPPRPLPAIVPADNVIRWSADGRSLLVTHAALPARVEQVDVQSGNRSVIPQIAPLHADVGLTFGISTVSDDYRSFAYSTAARVSTLFEVRMRR